MTNQERTAKPWMPASPCEAMAADLHAYYRMELTPDETLTVEAHLSSSGCAKCDAALTEMRQLGEILDRPELQPADPSEGLLSRIRASIATEDAAAEERAAHRSADSVDRVVSGERSAPGEREKGGEGRRVP